MYVLSFQSVVEPVWVFN